MNDYLIMFLAGLLGSLHCLGMCGGLITACGMKFGGGAAFSFIYNSGRVLSYSMLGLLMGFLGKALIATGLFGRFQSILPVAAGVFMVLIGLELLGLLPEAAKRPFLRQFPGRIIKRVLDNTGAKGAGVFVIGMMNGLIPCGLLYAAGLKAASTADPVSGMFFMASLGAGNFLPLLFTGSLAGVIRKAGTGALFKFSYILIIVLGAKSIIFGAGAFESISAYICSVRLPAP